LHQITAELLEGEGDFHRAIEHYQKALETVPALPGLHCALGVALLQASQDDASLREAQKHFEMELVLNPADANAEYLLGELCWRKNQHEPALEHFTRAVELRPGFVDALIALGKVWTAQGQTKKALGHLLEAVRLDPQNEVAHYRTAQVYWRSGDPHMAEKEMALFRELRDASASMATIYRQVQRNPIVSQSIESELK
jgi:tetratricopeptide (TPR) repeat protein